MIVWRRSLPWLKTRLPCDEVYFKTDRLIKRLGLHTVCKDARCPNIGGCWKAHRVTFLILGNICVRSCAFCAVATGMPQQVDPSEPKRVAQAVRALGVTHTVITSVTRDDLQDGGASIFAETIQRLKRYPEKIIVEILVPDFGGSREALNSVLAAGPDILAHNLETVPRLYPLIRPQADFQRSIGLLLEAKKFRSGITTKTGIMVGLGETEAELISVIDQIAETGIDILTIGQYLQPTLRHLPVSRYYHPSEFDRLREKAIRKGIPRVYSGPLVRSSRV